MVINTATMRRPIGEVSPDPKIIEWYREEGGSRITLGSDAHEPDHVGFDLDRARRLAGDAGLPTLARWEGRHPTDHSLTGGTEF